MDPSSPLLAVSCVPESEKSVLLTLANEDFRRKFALLKLFFETRQRFSICFERFESDNEEIGREENESKENNKS